MVKALRSVTPSSNGHQDHQIDRHRIDTEIVDIDLLVPDPRNARVHNRRNMEAIKESLVKYGQVKPLVVRRSDRVVIAGNGTLASAKELGWTRISVNWVDMNGIDAIGYGLADNRTAELAGWDLEVVKQLEGLMREAKEEPIGWSPEEIKVLRTKTEWHPPSLVEEGRGPRGVGLGESPAVEPLIVSFTPDQYKVVGQAIARMRAHKKAGLSQEEAMVEICRHWLDDSLPPRDPNDHDIPF